MCVRITDALMYFKFLCQFTEKRITRDYKKHVIKKKKYKICDKTFKRVGKRSIRKRFKSIRFKLVNSQMNGKYSRNRRSETKCIDINKTLY